MSRRKYFRCFKLSTKRIDILREKHEDNRGLLLMSPYHNKVDRI